MKKESFLFAALVMAALFPLSACSDAHKQVNPVITPVVVESTAVRSRDADEAALLISKDELDKAEAILKKNPESFDNLYLMGIIERERGNYAEAAGLFDKALVLKPGNPECLKYKSYLDFYMGKRDQAAAGFENLIKQIPDDPEVYYGIAMVYKAQGKIGEAENLALKGMDIELYVKIDGKGKRTRKDPGRIALLQTLTGKKGQEKITGIMRNDYEEDPSNPGKAAAYALLLFDYGKADDARKVISQALNTVPKNYRYKLHRISGEFFNIERRYPEAQKEYEKAMEGAPVNDEADSYITLTELYLLYGDCLFEQKKFEDSEKMMNKAREYIEKLRKSGDKTTAEEKMTDYYVNMATLSMRQGEMDKADRYLKQAEALKPVDLNETNVGDTANIRAEWLMKKGRFKEAVKVLSDMAKHPTESPDEIYIRMAAAYSGMKDRTKAVEALRAAFKLGSSRKKVMMVMENDKNFDFIRNDPEIKSVLAGERF